MNKKFKFTSAVLSAGLLITPVSGLVNHYDNVAKAEYNSNQTNQVNIENHIKYIDNQIYLENNNLKINKNIVLKYIQENFNELNINHQFNSPEMFYKNIELNINNLNNQVNSGWYKFNNEKGVSEKYQSRLGGSYYNNTYWWGEEYLVYNATQKAELSRDLAISSSLMGGGAAITGAIPIVAAGLGISAASYGIMATRVGSFWSDRLKLKIFRLGLYHTIDPI